MLGAVLTGGRSRRFGSDKARFPVAGEPMARRVASALAAAGIDRVVAVGGDVDAMAALGLTVVQDRWPGEGPVGALLTAFAHARSIRPTAQVVVVAPCDLVDLDATAVAAVLAALVAPAAASVAVDATSGRRQPLLSAWAVELAAPVVQAAFDADERSARAALAALATRGLAVVDVAVPSATLRNVNHRGDVGR